MWHDFYVTFSIRVGSFNLILLKVYSSNFRIKKNSFNKLNYDLDNLSYIIIYL